jgi:hypothetical protein
MNDGRWPMNDLAIAARFEALRLARLAVRKDLKAQGLKVNWIANTEIDRLARAWFAQDRAGLFDQALGNVLADVLCSNLRTAAQKSKRPKSMASTVRMSRTLEDAK